MVRRKLQSGLDQCTDDGVKLLLIGDSGSGKTSLIHSLVNDEFVYDLPPKYHDITIPADISPDRVPIHIADYSENDDSFRDNLLSEEIAKADVICIVYVACDSESLQRVAQYWLPTVRGLDRTRGSYRPIILVANKIDLVPEASSSEGIATLRDELLGVESHMEVSALAQKNVVELFSSAQRAYTYPIAPLYDTKNRTLTKKCRKVLTSIFKLNDTDKDGLLNDRELNKFQDNCFGTPLQRDALFDLKKIIKQSTNDGIVDNSVTLSGFLFIHELSIDRGRRDFTWLVLRKYNYNNQLEPQSTTESSLTSETTLDDTNRSTRITTTNDESNGDSSSWSLTSIIYEKESYLSETDASLTGNRNKTNGEFTRALLWLRQNPIILKAGLGITVTIFISFITLRYLNTGRN